MRNSGIDSPYTPRVRKYIYNRRPQMMKDFYYDMSTVKLFELMTKFLNTPRIKSFSD